MYPLLLQTITGAQQLVISNERRELLLPLRTFIQHKVSNKQAVNLHFICTHNSRRSILAQVWAQTAAAFYAVPEIHCYSGGTEQTALYPKIAEVLRAQGFMVWALSVTDNPLYAIKYADDALPLIGFSKKYDSPFNPASAFAAITTCSQAEAECPFIAGAEKRIPLMYDDPKAADGLPEQTLVYTERSRQIAAEMFYVFSLIEK